MTDKNCCVVAYYLNTESINLIAVVTDSCFIEKPNSSYQIQISDLDVEIQQDYITQSKGLIPLDIGGISITENIKAHLIMLGCKDNIFRRMTVNGENNILWQVCAPGAYILLNKELDAGINSTVYRGPIDNILLEINKKFENPIGCILGREDYQELVFSKVLYDNFCAKFDVSDLFVGLPLYDDHLSNIVNGNVDAIPNGCFDNCSSEYLDLLRDKELFALLKYASVNSMSQLGAELYKRLKLLKLPLAAKKDAMKLYKSLMS